MRSAPPSSNQKTQTPAATRFTVLIERRGSLPRLLGAAVTAAVLALALFGHRAAQAQYFDAPKFSADLLTGIDTANAAMASNGSNSGTGNSLRRVQTFIPPVWTQAVNGVVYAKVVVVSNSTDPDLASLRSAVLSMGGSVYYRYLSVRALSVLLPAAKIATLAARSDVTSVSPTPEPSRPL